MALGMSVSSVGGRDSETASTGEKTLWVIIPLIFAMSISVSQIGGATEYELLAAGGGYVVGGGGKDGPEYK
jgi:hypothetical protein